jgi:Natural resistance-associated macrophage protein
LITGASDDDPSSIATYSQSGAQFGYAMCWVMLFCFPLMAAIQEISARMGRSLQDLRLCPRSSKILYEFAKEGPRVRLKTECHPWSVAACVDANFMRCIA